MKVFATLFWQLDVVGILLMIIAFGFFLTPFTLAGGQSASWGEAKIIAPLVVGIVFFPIFVVWELKCRYPLIPFHVSLISPY
jgi:SIT family siderophore-iron:H+ symporter-like MFS transporter